MADGWIPPEDIATLREVCERIRQTEYWDNKLQLLKEYFKAELVKILFTGVLFLCGCHQAFEPASRPKGQWKLQLDYSDEFNGSVLDGDKWDRDAGRLCACLELGNRIK